MLDAGVVWGCRAAVVSVKSVTQPLGANEMTPTKGGHAAIILLACILPGGAVAHHSAAMFDDKQTVTLQGTVKQFQWSNPHCYIQLLVPAGGNVVEWTIEMGSPMQIYRGGWRPRTLHEGQKVTISIHPLRDGSHAGLFVSGAGADGATLGIKASARATP